MRLVIAACAAFLSISVMPAAAQKALGEWQSETGATRMRVAPCRGGLCGTITWLRQPGLDVNNASARLRARPLIGARLFFDMRPNGTNRWIGRAYVPGDGQTYAGRMTMDGNKLQAVACSLGGTMCSGNLWTRIK